MSRVVGKSEVMCTVVYDQPRSPETGSEEIGVHAALAVTLHVLQEDFWTAFTASIQCGSVERADSSHAQRHRPVTSDLSVNRPRSAALPQVSCATCRLAEVRHGTAEFCNFWCHQRDKSCLYNRGFRKSGVVQTYPLETSEG